MADQTWTAVAGGAGYGQPFQNGNRIRDVLPSYNPGGSFPGVVDAYSGATVDQSRNAYLVMGGGHTDYAGNEIYYCQLSAAAPGFQLVTLPTPGSQQGADNPSENYNLKESYADGTIRGAHTYSRRCCGGGYIWSPGTDGSSPNANWSTDCWAFNLNTAYGTTWPIPNTSAPWSYLGPGVPSVGGGSGEAGVGVWDRVNQLCWGNTSEAAWLYSINPNNAFTIAAYNIFRSGNLRTGTIAYNLRSATDPGCIIYYDDLNVRLQIVDVSNPTAPVRSVNNSVTSFGSIAGYYFGTVFHAASRALFFWNGNGASFEKIAIPSDPINGTYVHSTVAPAAGNSVTPTAAAAVGTYNRFNIIENMGNGQSALVVVNDISQPIYVYKLPVGGV